LLFFAFSLAFSLSVPLGFGTFFGFAAFAVAFFLFRLLTLSLFSFFPFEASASLCLGTAFSFCTTVGVGPRFSGQPLCFSFPGFLLSLPLCRPLGCFSC
jgi:hypothetical protein